MFVNKIFTYLTCAYLKKNKRFFNVKSSTYCFHMRTKILANIQICISVPFKTFLLQMWTYFVLRAYDYFFCSFKQLKTILSFIWTGLSSDWGSLEMSEAVSRRCTVKWCSWKFCEIHKKTPVPESFLIKL